MVRVQFLHPKIHQWKVQLFPCVCTVPIIVYSPLQGIADIRIDRKALPNAIRRFWSILSRLPNILIKGSWRNIDQNLTVASHAKLEALLSVRLHCTL
jgi:hypothetical protein